MVMTLPSKRNIFSIKKVRNQKKWKKEEDLHLISLAKMNKERNWKDIASHFSNKNPLQCFSRYKRIRPGIKKGTWKKEEDQKILELVDKHGPSWSKISKEIKTRNGKQIRDRYLNVLDPNINKGKFTQEDDDYLIKLYNNNGPKWALISKFFPNRTADMIKNRFHSSIKKKIDCSETLPKEISSPSSIKTLTTTAYSQNNMSGFTINNQYHDSLNGSSSPISNGDEEMEEMEDSNNLFSLDFFQGEREKNYQDQNDENWALGPIFNC